jgi:adenylate cyclase
VTILFSDLRGFTAMAENYSPSSIIELLNRYLTTMNEIIITQYGGTIDKFMGDCVMVLFGAPESKSDDIERALNCAVDMQMAMDKINETNKAMGLPNLFMGIGINSGKVIAGKIGSELHSEYTVIGDEVNLASRISAYSMRGQILISNNVFKETKAFIETGEPKDVFVKGKKSSIRIFELLAVKKPVLRFVPRREARKNPRVEVEMPFIYQKLSGKTILPENYKGTILNISYNGMLAIIEGPIDIFSEIKFPFIMTGSDIYAKILKCSEVGGQYKANIEFTSIQPDAREAIKGFIGRIIQGS